MKTPLALAQMPRRVAAAIHTVFTDIDDTLSSQGRLTAAAYSALEKLSQAGLRVIPVTGRPAGWCDHIARFWPVAAVVGENGAFYCWRDEAHAGRLHMRHQWDEARRAQVQQRLAAVRAQVLREVPGCAIASDQFCRLYDQAEDFCEDVPAQPQADIGRIVANLQASGMTAKVSSIHVNGWFGAWNKLDMVRTLMAERYGLDINADLGRYTFVGDSPNDAPMFAHFPQTVGVANVLDFAGRIEAMPSWVTTSRAGAGFVELAEHLLSARQIG